MRYPRVLAAVSLCLFFAGCAKTVEAPVSNRWQSPENVHVVHAGETLYSIAWRYGKDYRDLAKMNHIAPPYDIKSGRRLWLATTSHAIEVDTQQLSTVPVKSSAVITGAAPISKPIVGKPLKTAPVSQSGDASLITAKEPAATDKPAPELITPTGAGAGQWQWPVRGRLIRTFSTDSASKGVDIAAPAGSPVHASASGRVVYSGSGLRGYGELIIIKHNEEFLSAYAHNRKLLAHEGQLVKAGQVIAQVGDTDASQTQLHFEIRRAGKPVDPLQYLPK